MSDEVRSAIEISAPAAEVWEVVMDPARLGEWVSLHRRVRWGSGKLREGDSFEQTLRLGGIDAKIEWTVDELKRPRRAVWSGRGPARSRAHVVYELDQRGGVTRFEYANSFGLPGGALGRLAGRAISGSKARREAERSLAALKQLIEGEGDSERRPGSRGRFAATRSRLCRLAALRRGA